MCPHLPSLSRRHPLPWPQFLHLDQEGPARGFASRCLSHSKCQIRVGGPLFPLRRLLREKPDHSRHSGCQHLQQPSQCSFVKLYRRLQRQPELLVRVGPKAEHAQEFHSIRRSLPRIQVKVCNLEWITFAINIFKRTKKWKYWKQGKQWKRKVPKIDQ